MSRESLETNTPALMTVQQAAAFLNVGPGSIRRWASKGSLHGHKIGMRGDWRFTVQELQSITVPNISFTEPPRSHTPLVTKKIKHGVQFFEDDAFLVQSVLEYMNGAERGIIIATAAHRVELQKYLSDEVFTFMDAEETLATFMVDGVPDKYAFNAVVGGLLKEATVSGKEVRAFGEMVAILWQQRNPNAAVSLEGLWNELQKAHEFSLLCAYPMDAFTGESQVSMFTDMCDAHTAVAPTEAYSALHTSDDQSREIVFLQQKARSLEAEIEKSRKLERQKDDFLAVASHELKTPVTSLRAYGQVLQSRLTTDGNVSAANMVLKMDAQVSKLAKLIDDLLDVSKMQKGILSLSEEEFDCNELLEEVIDNMQSQTSQHNINARLNTPVRVLADRGRIGQVLVNLLSNAIKYSPKAHRIIVTSERRDAVVVVQVRDFGMGISADNQKKIFDQFYRVDDEEMKTFSGLGLGLHIANQLVTRMGGTLWVESKPGHGALFSFSIPIQIPT